MARKFLTSITCSRCGEEKDESEFYRSTASSTGRQRYCKDCQRETMREWSQTPQAKAARAARGPEVARTYRLMREYGISMEVWDEAVERQGGLCAICRIVSPTHVDHDHATGAFRGALCLKCNTLLGMAMDDPAVLRAALDYLGDSHG